MSLYGSFKVKPPLEGNLVILVHMNNVPSITLSVVKVYYTIIIHSTQVLHQLLSITCDEATKHFNFTQMLQFHVSHVSCLCCNFNLPYSYHVAMFQGMRNSCCIHMLHYYHSQTIKYETNIVENVAYACFSTMA